LSREATDRETKPLWTPKRRIAARVSLVHGVVLEGTLYADVHRLDGSPGSIVDRLEDPLVKYLPLAVDDRHVLLQKHQIVTIELGPEDSRPPETAELRELRVRLRLSTRAILEGSFFAVLSPVHSRVLDYLNVTPSTFLRLFQADRLALVNGQYVVEVSELLGRADPAPA